MSKLIRPWRPGTQILQQDTYLGRLITSRPETVVQDEPGLLALYTHPDAPYQSTVLRNRGSIPLQERYKRIADISSWKFEERRSGNYHTLTMTAPDSWNSVWLMWDMEWELKFWYVNFQEPIRRTARGIVVEDLSLDIVIAPDRSWTWKDLDEFEYSIERGKFTERQISSVRSESDRIVEVIKDWGSPFCDGWENWRANEGWPVPGVPGDWEELLAGPPAPDAAKSPDTPAP